MPDQFWLPKGFAQVKQLTPGPYSGGVEETGLRVYKASPDGVVVQWRVQSKNAKTAYTGTITHGTLTIAQARELGRYLLSNFGTLSDIDALQSDFSVQPGVTP